MWDVELPPVAGATVVVVELSVVELDLDASATGPVCPLCLYLSWSLRSKDFPPRVPEIGSGSASQSSSEDPEDDDGVLGGGPEELVLDAKVLEDVDAAAVGVVAFFVSQTTATT